MCDGASENPHKNNTKFMFIIQIECFLSHITFRHAWEILENNLRPMIIVDTTNQGSSRVKYL